MGRFISADTTEVLTASTTALTDKNLYAYCDNNPVVRIDIYGEYWDIAFDVVSFGDSVWATVCDPRNPINWAAMAGDFADLAIPYVSGIGESIKAYKAANAAAEIVDTTNTARKGWKVGDNITKPTSKGNTPSWTTVRNRHWKNEAHYNSSKYSGSDIKRMRKGRAPIGVDGYPVELHHPYGRDGGNYWIFYELDRTSHRRYHYGR